MKTLDLIHEFLAQPRFAFIGVSRNPRSFSRTLFRDFLARGYQIQPVNPFAAEIDGRHCYPTVRSITPPPANVFLMARRDSLNTLLRECAQSGATLAWLYGVSGLKDVPPETLRIAEEYGIGIIPGYCPYMFFKDATFFHRWHGSLWKMIGLFPK
jgi:predicted CoA-binding protein